MYKKLVENKRTNKNKQQNKTKGMARDVGPKRHDLSICVQCIATCLHFSLSPYTIIYHLLLSRINFGIELTHTTYMHGMQ